MKRIRMIISYDGTNYHGWQMQDNAITIEEILNKTLSELTGEKIEIIGASRTDSGVHALGNIAVFDSDTRIDPEKIAFALNQRLPDEIRIQKSEEVDADFHPRYCNSRKTYEYRISNRKVYLPTERLYSHFVYVPLDLERMQRAAEYLIGEHDFASFCSVKSQVKTTVRTIFSLTIKREENTIIMRITGNGFLYNMIRIIAGTMIKIGRGVWEPERMVEILEAKNRGASGPTAPAKGLTLISIDYE